MGRYKLVLSALLLFSFWSSAQDLARWTGGVKTQGNLPETWTAPTNLFDVQERNDNTAYAFASATSTLTLPSADLANGYLFVASFEYEDTSNGRFNPQGRFVQASGSGNFVTATAGGYNRDTSEDRSYVRTWAFVDGPSASSTYQFQWQADTDDSSGGTVRSSIEVIPLYYSNAGVYSSNSSAVYGGTTPNQVTGFTAIQESNTAAIELVSNAVTMKTDNKRYLAFGGQYFDGLGSNRTQRWHGFRVNGVKEDASKAYSYYRNGGNNENGHIFTLLLDRQTTDITLDQFCYRGDGVANLQGGADQDNSAAPSGSHAIVVLELNDSAEVFFSSNSSNSSALNASPTAIGVNESNSFSDATSFTSASTTQINSVQAGDMLFGANISAASNNVSTGARFTAFSEFTVNGATLPGTFNGNYLRNNQGSIDTFGWSANLLSYVTVSAGDDVGVTVTELAGTENGGNAVSVAGWSGFWGVNLSTLEGGGPVLENGFKVWTGSQFEVKPAMYWNGSAWIQGTLKRWDGSAWINLDF